MEQGSNLQPAWATCGEAPGSSSALSPTLSPHFLLCHGRPLVGVAWHGPAVPVAGDVEGRRQGLQERIGKGV